MHSVRYSSKCEGTVQDCAQQASWRVILFYPTAQKIELVLRIPLRQGEHEGKSTTIDQDTIHI
jgi:hypothetical protein